MNAWIDLSSSAAMVLSWVLQAVIFGTALALVTWMLLSTAFRGVRPAVQAVFWLVVLAKFLIPDGPGWSYSMSSLVAPLTDSLAAAPAPTASGSDLYVEVATVGVGQVAPLVGTARAPSAAPPTAAAGAGRAWLTGLAGAYLLGVLLTAGLRAAAYRRFVRRCATLPLAGRGARRMVRQICRRSGVTRIPAVRLSDEDSAPFVYGLFSPTLVLSRRLALSAAELEAVLLHEIAHLRRFDLVIRHVQWLVGTLLFFWPVVAWVNRRIDLAREHACDEWALRHGRLSPGQYARCLLNAARSAPPAWAEYRPAAMASNLKVVERRIDMIMDLPTRPAARRWLSMGAGAGALAWGCFVLTGATAAPSAPGQDEPASDERRIVMVGEDGQVREIKLNISTAPDAMVVAGGPGAMMIAEGAPLGGRLFRRLSTSAALGDGAGHMTMFRTERSVSPELLADFAEQHPAADADGDGALSLDEHDAYLTALAVSSPDQVLARFPQADVDGDGGLSAEEAAELVTNDVPGLGGHFQGGRFQVSLPRIAMSAGDDVAGVWSSEPPANVMVQMCPADLTTTVDGDGATATATVTLNGGTFTTSTIDEDVVTVTAPGGEGHEVRVEKIDGGTPRIWVNGEEIDVADADIQEIELPNGHLAKVMIAQDGELPADMDVIAGQMPRMIRMNAVAGADGELAITMPGAEDELTTTEEVFEFVAAGPGCSLGGAAQWLTENVDAAVTPAQVKQQLAAVRNAPLAAFLRQHPEADYNEDGRLTTAERDRYIEATTTSARQKLLERFPEADADADGLLTDDEMHSFFKSRGASKRSAFRTAAPAAEATAVSAD